MDIKIDTGLSQKKRRHNMKDGGEFLLTNRTIDRYRSMMMEGLDEICRLFETVKSPFSGISPPELRSRLKRIDTSKPVEHISELYNELYDLYLKDAVYFHHPRYLAHLNCPILIPSLLAELFASAINTSMDTWDQSAGATLIEEKVIEWIAKLIGYSDDADGTFTSGGTQSNFLGLLLARDSFLADEMYKDGKTCVSLDKMGSYCVFTSEKTHFSIEKACHQLGLGTDAIICIPIDRHYRMRADVLEEAADAACKAGRKPIAIVATAGTTDFGSIDPLTEIADFAQKNRIWFHVDAAYGCGLLASTRDRSRLNGIKHADSVTVDFHKSFFQPISCSALIVRQSKNLDLLTHHADYLNPRSARDAEVPNRVDRSIQTTRRFEALKIWLSLRLIGEESFGEMFECLIDITKKVANEIKKVPELRLLVEPSLTTLLFRYEPQFFPDESIDYINEAIRSKLSHSGYSMIASTRVNNAVYLKFTLLNPTVQLKDITSVLLEIVKEGKKLSTIVSHNYKGVRAS